MDKEFSSLTLKNINLQTDIINKHKQNVVLFGCGSGLDVSVATKAMENVKYIVDNDKNKWGIIKFGKIVKNPNVLLNENKENLIIIVTSEYYSEIALQLKTMGFTEHINFWPTPGVQSSKRSEGLKTKRKLLVTMLNGHLSGGGILKVDLETESVEKILEAKSFRGICSTLNGYTFVDENSIYIFDKDLKEYQKSVLSEDFLNLHGIVYSDGYYYIVETATNTLKVIDQYSLKTEKQLNFSTNSMDIHHVNDIAINGDSLYLSMISTKGLDKKNWWRFDDGAIIELDKLTLEFRRFERRNLKYPHSVKVFNNEMYVCQSKDGNLTKINDNAITKFNGFTRGLDYDGRFFYVGQSLFRGTLDQNNHFNLDAGIHIYDTFSNFSRFINLSCYYKELYGIQVINE